jgi:hypothetical protein
LPDTLFQGIEGFPKFFSILLSFLFRDRETLRHQPRSSPPPRCRL